jgi:ribonuclease VapC
MILDASAIVAVMLAEPGYEGVLARIQTAPVLACGAPTIAETALVLSSKLKRDARPLLNEFLRDAEVEIVPFSREHADAAVDAFLRFGKGRHPAGLNFGDAMSYAVARVSGLPLLYVGGDFAKTDLGGAGAPTP